eukprot:gene11635-15585_t
MRMYRKCLRLVNSWSENREVFNYETTKIRAEFDANKNANQATTVRLLREGYERMAKVNHPDPYIAPFMPGGSLFMRNPAIPLDVVYPHGIPESASRRRLNIDMSNIPDDQPFADQVFVDSCSKSYWINK